MKEKEDDPQPFGIDAATGRPLNRLEDDAIEAMAAQEAKPSPLNAAQQARREGGEARAFGVEADVDSGNLSQTGWGILYGPGVDQKIKDALKPLIDLRRDQGAQPLTIFDQDGYRRGESVFAWLKRRGVGLDIVVPSAGVPYYLMICAPPEVISFEFQYTLDLYWGVGRLWFDTPDEFRQYAESVVRYEKPGGVPNNRFMLFAPEHDFDTATQLFVQQVAIPLRDGDGIRGPVGSRQKFTLNAFLGETATKAQLSDILCGNVDGGSPALLFSGGHGMQFPNEDPLQLANQGALVCQDWDRLGRIAPTDWFAANDLPANAKVHGLIHFMFACHGGGVPQFDNFDRQNQAPRQIAPRPFFSKLPQALLTHPDGGALAVLAHIERAWAYSFQGEGGNSQVQGFRDVITRLLKGDRIGDATDSFNLKWAAVSTRLVEALFERQRDPSVSLNSIGRLWVQRDDARNFMILGDPAVRIGPMSPTQ